MPPGTLHIVLLTLVWLSSLSVATRTQTRSRSQSLVECASFPPMILPRTRVLSGTSVSEGLGSSSFTIVGGASLEGIFAAANDTSGLVHAVRRGGVLPRVTQSLLYPLEKGGSVEYSDTSTQLDTVVGATGVDDRLKGGLACTVVSSFITCRWPPGVGSGYESWQDEYLDIFLLLSPALTLKDGACRIPTVYLEAPATTLEPQTPLRITRNGVESSHFSTDTVRVYVGSVVVTATAMNNWLYLGLRGGLVVALGVGVCAFIIIGDTTIADLLVAVVLLDQLCATTTDHAHVSYARFAFRPFSGVAEPHAEVMYYGVVLLGCLAVAGVALTFCYLTSSTPREMALELEGPMYQWFLAASNSRCVAIVFVPALLLLPGTAAATCRVYTILADSSLSAMSVAQLFALIIGPLYCLVVLTSTALITRNCGGSTFVSSEASHPLQKAIPGTTRVPPMGAVCLLSPWYVRYLHPAPETKSVTVAKPISLRVAAKALRLITRRRQPRSKTYDANGNSEGSSDNDLGDGRSSFNDASVPASRRPSLPPTLTPRGALVLDDLRSPSIDDIQLSDCPVQRGPTEALDQFDSIRRAAAVYREEVRPAPLPPRQQDPNDLCGVACRSVGSVGGIDIRPTMWKRLFYPTIHWGTYRYRTVFTFLLGSARTTTQVQYLAPMLPHLVVVSVVVLAYSGRLTCQERSYGYGGVLGLNLLVLCAVRPYRYCFAAIAGITSALLLAAIAGVTSYSLHVLPISTGLQSSKDALLVVLLVVCLLRSAHTLVISLFIESGIDAVLDKVWNRIATRQEMVYMYHHSRAQIPVVVSSDPSPVISPRKEVEVPRPETSAGPTSSHSSESITPYPVEEEAPPAATSPPPFHGIAAISSQEVFEPSKSTELQRQATLVRNRHRYQYSNPFIPDAHTLDSVYRLTADDRGCIAIMQSGSLEETDFLSSDSGH